MLKKLKFKLLQWLLKDDGIENYLVRKIIGDQQVIQYEISDSENIEIHHCIIVNSTFKDNREISAHSNLVKGLAFTGNINTLR